MSNQGIFAVSVVVLLASSALRAEPPQAKSSRSAGAEPSIRKTVVEGTAAGAGLIFDPYYRAYRDHRETTQLEAARKEILDAHSYGKKLAAEGEKAIREGEQWAARAPESIAQVHVATAYRELENLKQLDRFGIHAPQDPKWERRLSISEDLRSDLKKQFADAIAQSERRLKDELAHYKQVSGKDYPSSLLTHPTKGARNFSSRSLSEMDYIGNRLNPLFVRDGKVSYLRDSKAEAEARKVYSEVITDYTNRRTGPYTWEKDLWNQTIQQGEKQIAYGRDLIGIVSPSALLDPASRLPVAPTRTRLENFARTLEGNRGALIAAVLAIDVLRQWAPTLAGSGKDASLKNGTIQQSKSTAELPVQEGLVSGGSASSLLR